MHGGNAFEVHSRLVWFIASRLLIFTICVSVLLCAFYMCMNTANVYIVLSDGLEKRVDVILTREDAPELNNYFHGDFLSADPAPDGGRSTAARPYVNYNITGFEHELTIESLWAWPWDSYATCTVVEAGAVHHRHGHFQHAQRGQPHRAHLAGKAIQHHAE